MPAEPILAKVWLGVGQEGFVFPELRDDDDGIKALKAKPDFAVCLSGGGLRAAACSIGWLQALHEMDILPKVRYLSSTSGGSWFNAAFSYQETVPLDTFLGRYTPPDRLTKRRLTDHAAGSFASVIDRSRFISAVRWNLIADSMYCDCFRAENHNHVRAWTRAVGSCFLKAYKMNDSKSTFALKGASQLRARLSGSSQVFTAMRNDNMPFPIICGCALPRCDLRKNFSLEFTPLYCGAPIRVEDVEELKMGGNLVEPFAFCSEAPEDLRPLLGEGQHPRWPKLRPKWHFSVMQAAGISSQAIAQLWVRSDQKALWDFYGCPELPLWSGIDFQSVPDMCMGDGGGTDNLAIFPALRRGMTRVLVCFASPIKPIADIDTWAAHSTDVSSLFGRVPSGSDTVNSKVFNSTQQVFDKAEFDVLHTHLMEESKAGRPLIWSRNLRVLPNAAQGVEGNYWVRTVWIVLGSPQQWVRQLPKSTRRVVEKIRNFPHIMTSKLDYEPEVTGALSSLAAWTMFEAEGEIRKLLLPPEALISDIALRKLPPHCKAPDNPLLSALQQMEVRSTDTTQVTGASNSGDGDDSITEAVLLACRADNSESSDVGTLEVCVFGSDMALNHDLSVDAGDVEVMASTSSAVQNISTGETYDARRHMAPQASRAIKNRTLKAPTGTAVRRVRSDAPAARTKLGTGVQGCPAPTASENVKRPKPPRHGSTPPTSSSGGSGSRRKK